jgi:hypothetical protein
LTISLIWAGVEFKKLQGLKTISALPIPQLSGLPFLGGNMTRASLIVVYATI